MTTGKPAQPPQPPQSNRDKMKDAVNQLMQQVKDDKAQTKADKARLEALKRRRQQLRGLQAALLFLVLIAASIYGYKVWKQPFAPPSGEAAVHDARKTLVFTASLINFYQRKTGQLPSNLSQLGVALPQMTYQRTGDSWVLSMSVEGRPLTIHKDDDPARFLAAH